MPGHAHVNRPRWPRARPRTSSRPGNAVPCTDSPLGRGNQQYCDEYCGGGQQLDGAVGLRAARRYVDDALPGPSVEPAVGHCVNPASVPSDAMGLLVTRLAVGNAPYSLNPGEYPVELRAGRRCGCVNSMLTVASGFSRVVTTHAMFILSSDSLVDTSLQQTHAVDGLRCGRAPGRVPASGPRKLAPAAPFRPR